MKVNYQIFTVGVIEMKDFKDDITNADAIKLISEAVSDNCIDTCDTCKCTEWCDYYKALQKVKNALSVAYVCKGSGADYPCQHTTDITKAKNFTEVEPGKWMENYTNVIDDRPVGGFHDD